ncbi:uncharacterized protein Tco025E_04644, partial [Trypanosoma conorhini]
EALEESTSAAGQREEWTGSEEPAEPEAPAESLPPVRRRGRPRKAAPAEPEALEESTSAAGQREEWTGSEEPAEPEAPAESFLQSGGAGGQERWRFPYKLSSLCGSALAFGWCMYVVPEYCSFNFCLAVPVFFVCL